jgi:hypothetical protein
MIPQHMHAGALHSGEDVGHVLGPLAVCVLIEIVDPITELDNEIGANGIDPIDEGLHQRQRRRAQFRPDVDPVVNIGDERDLQGGCHTCSFTMRVCCTRRRPWCGRDIQRRMTSSRAASFRERCKVDAERPR